ncbi:MAG: MucR family transcriptional regulator [Rhizobiales bacterium]|nr:MucR family transcriptional regulator [Hyphomicrobiales bacterium]
MDLNQDRLLRVAATLVRSYVARNYVPQAELPRLIIRTHSSLRQLVSKPDQSRKSQVKT